MMPGPVKTEEAVHQGDWSGRGPAIEAGPG